MTITLAAVYTPIAFQGGLTGSLFREFAFTLAGAVTISGRRGADALADDVGAPAQRGRGTGLAGLISRGFERSRRIYAPAPGGRLQRPRRHLPAWIVVSVLALVMFASRRTSSLPPRTRASSSASSTRPPTPPSTGHSLDPRGERAVIAIPEAGFTFQITFPTGGFWGVGLKPWDERKRNAFQILPEVQQRVAAIPGIQTFPSCRRRCPAAGKFPVEFVIASTAEPRRSWVSPATAAEGGARAACLPSRRSST